MDRSFEREWSTETPSLFIPFHYFVCHYLKPREAHYHFSRYKNQWLWPNYWHLWNFHSLHLPTEAGSFFQQHRFYSCLTLELLIYACKHKGSKAKSYHLCWICWGYSVVEVELTLLTPFLWMYGGEKKPLYWVWYTKSLKCQYLPLILSNPNPNKPNHLLKKKSYENSL